ncbi:hypothetical protein NQ317_012408 [Molorchus minor]|uniref:Uncharacterized protein n=1 Tax=Molorchus minor TaxID=1323400 RepID=A0ABQ9JJ64_9CUCU|nr:hypothetical protein NQ317_012408 [Molorchus minor]
MDINKTMMISMKIIKLIIDLATFLFANKSYRPKWSAIKFWLHMRNSILFNKHIMTAVIHEGDVCDTSCRKSQYYTT